MHRPSRRAKILIVDDDSELIAVLRDALSERWEIAVARDANAALREWESEPADVLLLDLRLGSTEDGIDVFHELRRRSGARPPALVVSGAEEATRTARALQLPVIQKPFGIEQLVGAIEDVLTRADPPPTRPA